MKLASRPALSTHRSAPGGEAPGDPARGAGGDGHGATNGPDEFTALDPTARDARALFPRVGGAFEGLPGSVLGDRGPRSEAARAGGADPEWKYVNVRRYVTFLETSIGRGTEWAVFEPNGEPLWAGLRETISAFLDAEWRRGALRGARPEEAYFVRCDRSTMTETDLADGRAVALIGVAPTRPAEFVIFRIGQKTSAVRG